MLIKFAAEMPYLSHSACLYTTHAIAWYFLPTIFRMLVIRITDNLDVYTQHEKASVIHYRAFRSWSGSAEWVLGHTTVQRNHKGIIQKCLQKQHKQKQASLAMFSHIHFQDINILYKKAAYINKTRHPKFQVSGFSSNITVKQLSLFFGGRQAELPSLLAFNHLSFQPFMPTQPTLTENKFWRVSYSYKNIKHVAKWI